MARGGARRGVGRGEGQPQRAAGADGLPRASSATGPRRSGLLAFTWVELAYGGRGDPSNLAVFALVYVAVQFVGMSLYGIETWNRYGDGFGVYYGLLARISPLHWTREGLQSASP